MKNFYISLNRLEGLDQIEATIFLLSSTAVLQLKWLHPLLSQPSHILHLKQHWPPSHPPNNPNYRVDHIVFHRGASSSAFHSPPVCATCTSQRITALCSSTRPDIVAARSKKEDVAVLVGRPRGSGEAGDEEKGQWCRWRGSNVPSGPRGPAHPSTSPDPSTTTTSPNLLVETPWVYTQTHTHTNQTIGHLKGINT